MRLHRLLSPLVALLLLGACATSTKAVRSEFEDIPVPKGLTYLADSSTIIESPTVKAARLVYRGRLEPTSLAAAWRATLEANGWRHVSSTSVEDRGTTQIYEKAGSSLEVRVWEGLFGFFTYGEVTASRALPPSTTTR
ncbi:MAG: hypothetical protein DME12_13735 [Candidatus Rokuibacteriota bacterium]|nr:MAG: hypothetical protein DME12_13735 [Candidatus Rokubacteria bacterium]PYM67731.1 MAG: hypothetical protein DME11_02845 [Candidatus Rokubacteria bacterium]PYN71391.1 MAG: hypothetical protein DMD93_00130 [Candidatus Rokubacteria bacterium]